MALIIDEPLQVGYDPRSDSWPYGWLWREQHPFEMADTKKQAVREAKRKARTIPTPGVVILTQDNTFQRFWVNETYFKRTPKWKETLANTEPGSTGNYSRETDQNVIRDLRHR